MFVLCLASISATATLVVQLQIHFFTCYINLLIFAPELVAQVQLFLCANFEIPTASFSVLSMQIQLLSIFKYLFNICEYTYANFRFFLLYKFSNIAICIFSLFLLCLFLCLLFNLHFSKLKFQSCENAKCSMVLFFLCQL